MPNVKSFLRNRGEGKRPRTQDVKPRKILTPEEKEQIYKEYTEAKISVKEVCNKNNICISTLYSNIIPYVSKLNGIEEKKENVTILNLENELKKVIK